ncbi:MAG TPA: NusG domain II-containing protein [Ignavibacteriaceae bacterium]|nr:NusG domain II-containing protein [Ignavibacteriaceae bacterium]
MLSRRSFLKLSGITAVSLGSGFGIGKIVSSQANKKSIILCGFLPNNQEQIVNTVKSFVDEFLYNETFSVTVRGEDNFSSILRNQLGNRINSTSNRHLNIRLTKLTASLPSDILIKTDDAKIFSPDTDFSAYIQATRNSVLGKDAVYQLNVESTENSILDIFNSNNKVAVIENSKGIVEKIELNRKATSYKVSGNIGDVVFNIGNGNAHVHSSTCRHQLCKKGNSAFASGDFIACAPNKVILRIERS